MDPGSELRLRPRLTLTGLTSFVGGQSALKPGDESVVLMREAEIVLRFSRGPVGVHGTRAEPDFRLRAYHFRDRNRGPKPLTPRV